MRCSSPVLQIHIETCQGYVRLAAAQIAPSSQIVSIAKNLGAVEESVADGSSARSFRHLSDAATVPICGEFGDRSTQSGCAPVASRLCGDALGYSRARHD